MKKLDELLGPDWLNYALAASRLPIIRHILPLCLPYVAFVISITITASICGILHVLGLLQNVDFTINFLALVELITSVVLLYKKGNETIEKLRQKLQQVNNNK